MLHIAGEQCRLYSYGLLVGAGTASGTSIFISTDAVFQPELLNRISRKADLIFHDCETSAYKTDVHAHYDQLCTLPATARQKMWLYHYQANPTYTPREDGFQGFVVKGQEFSFHV
jgi:ribonuclease BN (tRNA processing enzyme)